MRTTTRLGSRPARAFTLIEAVIASGLLLTLVMSAMWLFTSSDRLVGYGILVADTARRADQAERMFQEALRSGGRFVLSGGSGTGPYRTITFKRNEGYAAGGIQYSDADWRISWRPDNDSDPLTGDGTLSITRGALGSMDVAFDVTDFGFAFYQFDTNNQLVPQAGATPSATTVELRMSFTIAKVVGPRNDSSGGYEVHREQRTIHVALRNPAPLDD